MRGKPLGFRHATTRELHTRMLAWIEGYQHETGKRPSQTQIGEAFGMSQRGAGKHVQTLIVDCRLIVPADKDGLYKVRG